MIAAADEFAGQLRAHASKLIRTAVAERVSRGNAASRNIVTSGVASYPTQPYLSSAS